MSVYAPGILCKCIHESCISQFCLNSFPLPSDLPFFIFKKLRVLRAQAPLTSNSGLHQGPLKVQESRIFCFYKQLLGIESRILQIMEYIKSTLLIDGQPKTIQFHRSSIQGFFIRQLIIRPTISPRYLQSRSTGPDSVLVRTTRHLNIYVCSSYDKSNNRHHPENS